MLSDGCMDSDREKDYSSVEDEMIHRVPITVPDMMGRPTKTADGSFILDPVYMINSGLLYNKLLCWAGGNEKMLKNMMSIKSSKNQDGRMIKTSTTQSKMKAQLTPCKKKYGSFVKQRM